MAEYIERKIALSIREPSKSDRHYQTCNLDDVYGQGWDDALCCIESIPAADVAPVVHGRWVDAGRGIKACSNCNHGIKEHMACVNHYCPNCGARMDGGGAT